MNARTSIIAAAALLALAIPAAAGARTNTSFRAARETAAEQALGQSLAVHKSHAVKTGKAAKKAAAKSSKSSTHPVIYIKLPGSANPSTFVDPNECQDSGTNCTDQQSCEFWALNCDLVGASALPTASQPAAPVAPATPAGDSGNTTPPTPPSTTPEFNADNCADYYDYINTGDPSYC